MRTTREIAKRLDGMFVRFATETEDEAAIRRVATAREAAARLDELERENARMREALQLIANATHPRFLAEHDIHLLHVSEKTFGDCINVARAALAGSGE